MRIEHSFPNSLSAADVYAMSIDQRYQERKCRDAGALSWDVTVTPSAPGAHVRTRRKMPTTDFPALLRKFVPSGVSSTETIVWGAADADGARTAALIADFHGTPASLTGTIRIVPDGAAAARIVVDVEFKAHVPLIAGRVEGFAAPIIRTVIDSEQATAQAWAAGAR